MKKIIIALAMLAVLPVAAKKKIVKDDKKVLDRVKHRLFRF